MIVLGLAPHEANLEVVCLVITHVNFCTVDTILVYVVRLNNSINEVLTASRLTKSRCYSLFSDQIVSIVSRKLELVNCLMLWTVQVG